MVVGEPTLMGGEFGDKDERLIARLENSQYDPNEQSDETGATDQPVADHCVRPIPGTSASSTTTFGAPPPPVTVVQSRTCLCPPTGSPPSAIQSPWGIDKLAVPVPQPQSGSTIPNDKLPTEFD